MHENRILKTKEGRFNDEYNTLEEENTTLQKTLSRTKQTLVEFEGLKVENKSLLDEVLGCRNFKQSRKDIPFFLFFFDVLPYIYTLYSFKTW